MPLLQLEGAQAVLPEQWAVPGAHVELPEVDVGERPLADAVEAVLHAGIERVRAGLPFQRQIILFVEGNSPALAAAQTAARGQTVKIVVVRGAQVGFKVNLVGHGYTSFVDR